jgi:hypothetical protein
MAARRRPGDNGAVKASRPAWVIDLAIAVAATVASVAAAIAQTPRGGEAVYAIPGPHVGFWSSRKRRQAGSCSASP